MSATNKHAKSSSSVRLISLILMLLIALSCTTACDIVEDVIKNPVQLDPPSNLRIENGNLCWNPVENAIKYLVSIDGNEYYSDSNTYSLASVKNGNADSVINGKTIGACLQRKNIVAIIMTFLAGIFAGNRLCKLT
jgi:hypothetical protein